MTEKLVKMLRELKSSLFCWRKKIMDWGLVSGLAALCGVVVNFLRFGKWQGIIETKVTRLEWDSSNALAKFDAIEQALKDNNEILTELKVKLEVMLERKARKRND